MIELLISLSILSIEHLFGSKVSTFALFAACFLCKILNLISWIASKVIIIASIAGASIHGYQIYIGHAVQYKIFILCAIGFIVSLFLPSILRVLPRILEGINNRLKRFVF